MTTTKKRYNQLRRRHTIRFRRTVVDDRPQYGAPQLCEEHDTGRDLEVLAHLEIACKSDRRRNDVVTPHRELLRNQQSEEI